MNKISKILTNLPSSPGVYYFYDSSGRVIYVGKASVLKTRVKSYFQGAHDNKTEKLISQIANIKYQQTETVFEALILEANEIKRLKPKYNMREKDDKSFNYIFLTNEKFPRFFVERATYLPTMKIKEKFGPFTSGLQVQEALKILRRIFGYRDCNDRKFLIYQKKNQPCLFHPLKLCPAPCTNLISAKAYQTLIKEIKLILAGKKNSLIRLLKKEMGLASRYKKFELAASIRNKIMALKHLQDVAIIKNERSIEQIRQIPRRIEAYDISNLPAGRQASYAVGSMVVFENGVVEKNQYRKFKIIACRRGRINNDSRMTKQNDPAMIAEIISRRIKHLEWPMPDLIILDGGKGQLSAVMKILRANKLNIAVMAIAKGPSRRGYALFKNNPAKDIYLEKLFVQGIRDEAHRFAINYHRKLREKIA